MRVDGDDDATPPVSLTEIRDAATVVATVAVRTPLVPVTELAPGLSVKPECLQPVGSFKLRGAYTAISSLSAEQRRRGVVTHSSGNHGRAVAYAAALLGVRAVVVVPWTAPSAKLAAITAAGAELVTVEPTMAARVTAAELLARDGAALVPPFDDRRVIAGQGTVGLEIAADAPDVDLVVVPVGGGGLISGVAAAIAALCPGAVVVGAEPALAADARESLRRGKRVAWPATSTARTVADALRVEQVGVLPWAHLRRYVADVVTVSDDELLAAVRALALDAHLVAEPGGAAAVAAVMFRRDELPAAAKTVAVVSGGNIDPRLLARALGTPHASGTDPTALR